MSIFSSLWLTPTIRCGLGWRGPCELRVGRDRPDRQLNRQVRRPASKTHALSSLTWRHSLYRTGATAHAARFKTVPPRVVPTTNLPYIPHRYRPWAFSTELSCAQYDRAITKNIVAAAIGPRMVKSRLYRTR